jgi:hypothetical protein
MRQGLAPKADRDKGQWAPQENPIDHLEFWAPPLPWRPVVARELLPALKLCQATVQCRQSKEKSRSQQPICSKDNTLESPFFTPLAFPTLIAMAVIWEYWQKYQQTSAREFG